MRVLSPSRAALFAAFAALLLAPAVADAATYILRPTSTQVLQTGWVVNPSSSTADAVLSKPVLEAAPPDTSSYLIAEAGSKGSWAGVGVAAPPVFRSGETFAATTAWAYLHTTSSTPLTLALWTGSFSSAYTVLASTTIPKGQPAGWFAVSSVSGLTPSQLSQLAVGFQPIGTTLNSAVYTAYVEVDTNDPSGSGPSAGQLPGVSLPSGLPGVGLPSGGSLGSKPSLPRSPAFVHASTIKLSDHARSIRVLVSCAAGTVGGCHGELALSLASPSSSGRSRAVAARCARGCRELGRTNFDVAAGHSKRIKVRIARVGRHLFGVRTNVEVQATVTTHDASGHAQQTSTRVTLIRVRA